MSNTLYDLDFYAWANEQASLLRAGRFAEIDVDNIAEEIESMGRSQKSELVNRLAALLAHLLKWRYQPSHRGNSWRLTIEEQRRRLADHLADNPSLNAQIDSALQRAYRLARLQAARETGLGRDAFTDGSPFAFDQIAADDFWPD
jgi:Domain of unknown function DUF29